MNLRQQIRLRTRVRETGARLGWHVVPAGRYDVTPRGYYSALPDLGALAPQVWDQVSAMRGVEFDVEVQFAWAEEHLAPFAGEFGPPDHGDPGRPEYFLFNHSYQAGDANTLYAMVRHAKPVRIVELGSGFSTLVMAQAVVANRADGHATRLESYNPYPEQNIGGQTIDGLHAHYEVEAQDIPLEIFESLAPGDILFVDTTHTVKVGSEVNRIVLDILPALGPGVFVHFHDISLPYEYPKWLIERMGAWSEQYLLQAFLAFNPRYRILFGVQAMARQDPGRLTGVAPQFYQEGHYPSAFWILSS